MADLLRILGWPISFVICFIFAVVLFRKDLSSLLSRITSVGRNGIRASEPRLRSSASVSGEWAVSGRRGSPAHGLRFFLSTPLSGVGTQEQYDKFMAQIKPVVAKIRALNYVESVYYFNEFFESINYRLEKEFSVPDYLTKLAQSDYLIIILNTNSVSSVYFEAGYALGKEIRAIYFLGPQAKVPSLMEDSAFTYPKLVRCQSFQALDEIPEMLRQIMPVLHDEERNQQAMSGRPSEKKP